MNSGHDQLNTRLMMARFLHWVEGDGLELLSPQQLRCCLLLFLTLDIKTQRDTTRRKVTLLISTTFIQERAVLLFRKTRKKSIYSSQISFAVQKNQKTTKQNLNFYSNSICL